MRDNTHQQLQIQIENLQRDLRQTRQELNLRFSTLESALRINGHLSAINNATECRGHCLLKLIWTVTFAVLFAFIYYLVTR